MASLMLPGGRVTDRTKEVVRQLFDEALQQPSSEREAWLRAATDDVGVQDEVRSLLDALEAKGGAIDRMLAGLPQMLPGRGRVGQMVGSYRIVDRVGEGGMGVVYRAQDTRLDRQVALKFLAPEIARDPEAQARFLHEAKIASTLDHPAICTVYGIERTDGGEPFIAMAWIDGETLRDRIRRRPLPVTDALDIAEQVAEGLAHAHAKGVLHRDVKSTNVIVTPEGTAKLIDFGLAKVAATSLTRSGEILGTVGVMSPEQIGGQTVDARTDIWSFGVLLYEMLTGVRPFCGDGPEAVAWAILHSDPEPISALRSGVPVAIDGVVAKALAKAPGDRYQHIDELPVDIRRSERAPRRPASFGRRERKGEARAGRWTAAAAVFLAGGLGLVAGLLISGSWPKPELAPPPERPIVRFSVPLGTDRVLSSWYQPLAVSPDGRQVAYAVGTPAGSQLRLRSFDRIEDQPLSGTDGAESVFFSPDSQELGFFAGGQLMRLRLKDGIPQRICAAPQGSRGASWGPNGDIVWTMGVTSGLFRVSAAGGEPETLLVPDTARGEIGLTYPQHLPTGDLLMTVWTGEGWRTAIWSEGTDAKTVIFEGGAAARYLAPGYLVIARMSVARAEPELLAVRFDLARREVIGRPVSVLGSPGLAGPNFSVADDGTLVFVAGGSPAWVGLSRGALVWRTNGGQTTTAVERGFFTAPRVGPEGRRVAVADLSPTGTYDIWTIDLARGARARITDHGSINNFPIWGPTADDVTFTSGRRPPGLFRKRATGTEAPERLVARKRHPQVPGAWSRDGARLLFTEMDASGQGDIWVFRPPGSPRPWLATAASELAPALSPEGRLIAWASNASGRYEVYVDTYDETTGPSSPLVVSVEGGRAPLWSVDGRTLYYVDKEGLMAVPVRKTPRLGLGASRRVLMGESLVTLFGHPNYDVDREGRVLMVRADPGEAPTQLQVVLNWVTHLRHLVPPGPL